MEQINQNFNNKYQFGQLHPAFKENDASMNIPEVTLPDIYYTPEDSFEKKSFKETIKQADMMGMVTSYFEHPILAFGTWFGCGYLMDRFSDACNKEYDKSLVGKAAKFGDKIAQSKAIDNNTVKSIEKYWHKGVDGTKKFLQKSQLYRAITETPIHPEWKMVKGMSYTCKQEVEQEFVRIMDILKIKSVKNKDLGNILSPEVMDFNELGLDKKEKEMLRKLGKIDEAEAINRVLLKRLGVTDSEIETIVKSSDATIQVKNRILKTLGLTLEDIKKIEEDMSGTEIDKVLKACQKAGNKIHVGQGHYSFLGILTKPFERNLEVRGVGNKLYSLGDGAKTNFGRLMSKFVQQAYRGLTFNAGKLGLLIFITPGLVRAMENTKKADKDKKVGTAAWGILDTLTWVITFPLSINLLYGLGGMRYAGMTKDKVEACRKIKAEFNEKVCNGSLKEKSAYDRALKEAKGKVKELEKVKSQSLFTKIMRKVAMPLSRDLRTETFMARQSGNTFMDIVRKIPHFGSNVVGVPLKFILGSFVFIGMFDAIIKKCCNKVFGKDYDASIEEEQQQNLKQQKVFTRKDLQERLLDAQKNKLSGENPDTTNQENLDEKFAAAIDIINKEPVDETKRKVKHSKISQSADNSQSEEALTNDINNIQEKTIDNKEQNQISETVNNEENLAQSQEFLNSNQAPIPDSAAQSQFAENVNKDGILEQKKETDDYTYIPNQDSTIQSQAEDIKKRYIPNQDSTIESQVNAIKERYIPSQDNVIKNKEEQKGQYIPSQKNNVKSSFDTPNFDKAFSRADRAEQNALQLLAGNFPE